MERTVRGSPDKGQAAGHNPGSDHSPGFKPATSESSPLWFGWSASGTFFSGAAPRSDEMTIPRAAFGTVQQPRPINDGHHPGATLRDHDCSGGGHVPSLWIMSFVPDVTVHVPEAAKRSQSLREQAERCRRLAAATTDRAVSRRLLELAAEFEKQAETEERRSGCLYTNLERN
jgi:hypothetical protein